MDVAGFALHVKGLLGCAFKAEIVLWGSVARKHLDFRISAFDGEPLLDDKQNIEQISVNK
ncbi:Unknown protein sequence [Pseudomonas amygdali pv. lachrymans]|uniref:Uncharacterized protein n=1 Tax=Pseudomonas amygdali pv. lachrymans TaxID=53707 RepID=A0ABR5KRQ2_PSEAV|nr:Unknown protein sequence [Pseudomonas amygdali pv. lachrymans]